MVIAKVKPKTGGNKKGSRHSSKEQRDVALGMHRSGLSCRTISSKLCIPKSTIHDWIDKIDTKGSHERLSGSGRPRITSPTDDQDWTLKDRKVTNKAELWTALQEGWQALPVDLLTRLVDSMPRRLQAVIDSKGYPTKY